MKCEIKSIYKIGGIGLILELKILNEGSLKRGICFRVVKKNLEFKIKDIERENFDTQTMEYTYNVNGENIYPVLATCFQNGNWKSLQIGDVIESF